MVNTAVYPAKYGKVWEHIKSGRIAGDKLKLEPGENINEYRQVPPVKSDTVKAHKPAAPRQAIGTYKED
jgi:hypothetical protein